MFYSLESLHEKKTKDLIKSAERYPYTSNTSKSTKRLKCCERASRYKLPKADCIPAAIDPTAIPDESNPATVIPAANAAIAAAQAPNSIFVLHNVYTSIEKLWHEQ